MFPENDTGKKKKSHLQVFKTYLRVWGEKKCNHSKKQRLLSGTFTLAEVAFAVKEQKYEMVKI